MKKLNWAEIKKRKIYWITDHLMGHVAWEELSAEKRSEFIKLHQTTKGRGYKFITSYAQENEEEDFCECLACYKENAWQLFLTDIQKFRFFNKLAKEKII